VKGKSEEKEVAAIAGQTNEPTINTCKCQINIREWETTQEGEIGHRL
jgi:hypothetical protein